MKQAQINTPLALPEQLLEEAQSHWQAYLDALAEASLPTPTDPILCRQLQKLFVCSEFARQLCLHDPVVLDELQRSGDLFRNYCYGEQLRELAHQVIKLKDEEALKATLRSYRNAQMLRIAFRDIAGWNDLDSTTNELSWLAEACIECALGVLTRWQKKDYGRACNAAGEEQELIVIGMGKLGAHELNYSSDIDLIFVYPEEGMTRGKRDKLENAEYFTRLGQRLINVLDQTTADGFVFRVDMRLRPFGESGPLAMSFDAFEDYYQTHGREWERYAMIKARIVAGDRIRGQQIMDTLRPFVYRRYIDFGAFESLREMKGLIEKQVLRKGMNNNIKLGAGGIREIEFIGQAFQLIHGGRRRALRQRPILVILDLLVDVELLPEYVADELTEAYIFLRNCEHRLQMWRDEQTHDLPADASARQRLACAMDQPDWDTLSRRLEDYRAHVNNYFRQVFEAPQSEQQELEGAHRDLQSLWQDTLDSEQVTLTLEKAGYEDTGEIIRRLEGLRDSHACRNLSAQGAARLDTLMPLLLGAAGAMTDADVTVVRLFDLVEQIARRSAYIALLIENPVALSQLVKLCAASPWISEHLAEHPVLLDELIDARSLYGLPDRAQREAELDSRMQGIDKDDLERQMDILRQFQKASMLRVAAADVNVDMPLMEVSNHLTEIAEVILNRVLELAWQHMVRKHGRPGSVFDGQACNPGFAILGYGKLGGIELGYGSDLDIVFLHAGVDEAMTDGKQPIETNVFFARLAQRVTHFLNTQTTAGLLYEVDLRLRPSGASGMLVASLSAFESYQHEDAWTWEHQALVRARVVAGDQQLGAEFERVRAAVLATHREQAALREQVSDMHTKMAEQLGSRKPEEFDLKQDPGGIVEIEFMVQYAVLQWSEHYPQLLVWTDNIRLIGTLVEVGLLDEQDGEQLANAYRAYRAEVHRLKLQEKKARVPADRFVAERATVQRLWKAWLD